jgi:hypothetical protein
MTLLDAVCICVALGCAIISATLSLFLCWIAIRSMTNDRD